MALDIALLMQYEVGEVCEPGGQGRGGSSTMPHKHNPTACTLAIAAAQRAPGLLANFLAGMLQEHERAAGRMAGGVGDGGGDGAGGGRRAGVDGGGRRGVTVDAARMRRNIDATHGAVFAEKAEMLLAREIGREAAHRAVEESAAQDRRAARTSRVARAGGVPGQRRGVPPAPGGGGIAMPFADSEGCRIYYRLEGLPGRPLLVLGHSLGADHGMWDPQMPALLTRFQVLRLDLRGHGASDVPAGDYTMAQLAGDVLAAVDADWPRAFAYCGLSLGGMIGQWLGLPCGRSDEGAGAGQHFAAHGRPGGVRYAPRHGAGAGHAGDRGGGDAALLLGADAGLGQPGGGVGSHACCWPPIRRDMRDAARRSAIWTTGRCWPDPDAGAGDRRGRGRVHALDRARRNSGARHSRGARGETDWGASFECGAAVVIHRGACSTFCCRRRRTTRRGGDGGEAVRSGRCARGPRDCGRHGIHARVSGDDHALRLGHGVDAAGPCAAACGGCWCWR